MFEVYLDESGGVDTPWLIMAGLVSTPEKWAKFGRGWQQALSEFGLGHFHMKEFVNPERGPFAKLDAIQKDNLLKRLIALIRRRGMFWVGCPVQMGPYNDVVRGELKKIFRDPYYFCFRDCINGVLKHCRKNNIEEQLAFFVDEKKGFSGHARRIYEQYKTLDNIHGRVPNSVEGSERRFG